MTPLQVFLAVAGLMLTLAGLLLAYALPAWRKKKEAVAQVGVLTKECNGIIRLLLNQLDSTAGT